MLLCCVACVGSGPVSVCPLETAELCRIDVVPVALSDRWDWGLIASEKLPQLLWRCVQSFGQLGCGQLGCHEVSYPPFVKAYALALLKAVILCASGLKLSTILFYTRKSPD